MNLTTAITGAKSAPAHPAPLMVLEFVTQDPRGSDLLPLEVASCAKAALDQLPSGKLNPQDAQTLLIYRAAIFDFVLSCFTLELQHTWNAATSLHRHAFVSPAFMQEFRTARERLEMGQNLLDLVKSAPALGTPMESKQALAFEGVLDYILENGNLSLLIHPSALPVFFRNSLAALVTARRDALEESLVSIRREYLPYTCQKFLFEHCDELRQLLVHDAVRGLEAALSLLPDDPMLSPIRTDLLQCHKRFSSIISAMPDLIDLLQNSLPQSAEQSSPR